MRKHADKYLLGFSKVPRHLAPIEINEDLALCGYAGSFLQTIMPMRNLTDFSVKLVLSVHVCQIEAFITNKANMYCL